MFTSLRVLGIALSCIGFGPPALMMLAVSARRRNLVLKLVINKNGTVKQITVVRAGDSRLAGAEGSCVRQLQLFDPVRLIELRAPNRAPINRHASGASSAFVAVFRFAYAVDSSGAATQVDIKDPGNNVLRITYDRSGYRLEHIAIGKTLPALR